MLRNRFHIVGGGGGLQSIKCYRTTTKMVLINVVFLKLFVKIILLISFAGITTHKNNT